tara:strand:- start:26566 stop:27252 length:687 start_codon:yes stop_codon:yes gene_type:complete
LTFLKNLIFFINNKEFKLSATKAKLNKIIKATLDLLRDHELDNITFLMISKKCTLDANDIKRYFLDIDSIIHAYFDDIDLRMIDSYSSNVTEETGKEIIFNIIMSRLDLLNENKISVKRLVKGKSNLKISFFIRSTRIQKWILQEANIHSIGFERTINQYGLMYLYARIINVWLEDNDPMMSKTMAFLDKSLTNGEKYIQNMQMPIKVINIMTAIGRQFFANIKNKKA